MLAKIFVCLLLVVSFKANAAYFLVNESNIDFQKRTHIIVSSKGNDLGLSPQLASASLAREIATNFVGDQILLVLVSANDQADNLRSIHEMGLSDAVLINQTLKAKTLIDEMAKFSQIASFHFFGHSAITEGLFLDAIGEQDVRWYPSEKEASRLAGHFTADAIAMLEGCNTGQLMARTLSSTWAIPVAGSLTSTHFETLYKDGHFYSAEESTAASWLTKSKMATYRMRPDNVPYEGVYGKYQQGLPIYKFFCVGIEDRKCFAGIALSLKMFIPEKPDGDALSRAREFLCPAGLYPSKLQQSCMHNLEKIDLQNISASTRLYTPFEGVSSQCSFLTCYENLKSNKADDVANWALSAAPPLHSSTFIDEYLNYIHAIGENFLGARTR